MHAFLSGIQMIGYSPVVSSGYDEYPDVARLAHVHLTPAVSAVWLEFTFKPPSAPRDPFQLTGLSPQPGSLLSSPAIFKLSLFHFFSLMCSSFPWLMCLQTPSIDPVCAALFAPSTAFY